MEEEFKNISEEKLMSVIGDILIDTNRCIFNWMNLSSRDNKFKINYDEIKGLLNNWIARHLRPIIGQSEVHWLFRSGKPIVEIDSKTGYISKVTICTPGNFGYFSNAGERIRAKVAQLFSAVDCRSFYYNPARKEIDELFWNPIFKTSTASVADKFNNVKFTANVPVDLSSISKISFKL